MLKIKVLFHLNSYLIIYRMKYILKQEIFTNNYHYIFTYIYSCFVLLNKKIYYGWRRIQ